MAKQGFYSKQAPAPDKKAAARNPMPGPFQGTVLSPTVPLHPAKIHGLGTPTHVFGHRNIKGVHSFGHLPKARVGHLRLSGAPKSHQIGKRK